MGDLKSPGLMYLKAGSFVLIGCAAATLILVDAPSWRLALLLAVTVWAFCRAYYFAFYVIEHYLDPGYRFAGLTSFARYLWSRTRRR